MSETRLREAILALARERAPAKTICPSDAARAVGGDQWRDLMEQARDIARDLASAGEVEIMQRGEVLDPNAQWRGPIRIRATSGISARLRSLSDRLRAEIAQRLANLSASARAWAAIFSARSAFHWISFWTHGLSCGNSSVSDTRRTSTLTPLPSGIF